MATFTKGSLEMDSNMEKGSTSGLMALTIRETGLRVKSREKVFICKVMVESIMDNGRGI